MAQRETVELQIVLFVDVVEFGSGYGGRAWACCRRSAARSGVVVMSIVGSCVIGLSRYW